MFRTSFMGEVQGRAGAKLIGDLISRLPGRQPRG